MLRIMATCGASIILYIVAFACVLDRPLTLGALRTRIEAGLTLGQSIHEPKLVILAGSNGPFSHRCETIEPIIHRPCINAGVAVGIGLDYLFTRWQKLLRPGDIVYLPLEEAQYARPRATAFLGPDAAIMLRHDRTTLWTLPFGRQISAVFASGPRAVVMSLLETALFRSAWASDGFRDPRIAASSGFNSWGDHIGHTAALAARNQATLAAITPYHPSGTQISTGDGTIVVIGFLHWAERHGVHVIGGLPTGFLDSPIGDTSLAAIQAIYRDNGADFLELANHSRYPRTAFFDTQDHLNEAAQIAHSALVAAALAPFMDQTPAPSR